MFAGLLASLGLGKTYPTITKEDIKEYGNNPMDGGLILIVAGKDVYDVIQYIDNHPGGAHALIRKAGGIVDCTRDLHFHSSKARAEWEKHKVAEIGPKTTLTIAKPVSASPSIAGSFAATPTVMTNKTEFEPDTTRVIGTQTLCSHATCGNGPCFHDASPAGNVEGPVCVWSSSGTGSIKAKTVARKTSSEDTSLEEEVAAE